MKCPKCIDGEARALDTRTREDGSVMRRRECTKCGERYTTCETLRFSSEFEEIERRLFALGFTQQKVHEILGDRRVKPRVARVKPPSHLALVPEPIPQLRIDEVWLTGRTG